MEKIAASRVQQFSEAQDRLGATYLADEGVHIRLWAPKINSVDVEWVGKGLSPLKKQDDGYFTGYFPLAKSGDRYYFHCDGQKIADPASRFQPEGVFGPSEVVALDFAWSDDNWQGIPAEQWVVYEIHTGTFSESHDFEGIIKDLPRLKDLGITTLEIMPVSQFSGERNWGYDGVFPHAVQNSYGGPEGLKNLINQAHAHGLAVILDVVYNHIGPEGNVLFGCGFYTQDKYKTPWGDALNYDGAHSDEVRRYFLQTVWQWLTEYHLDGLRLDAVQTILDTSPVPFLQEVNIVKEQAEEITGRDLVLIAESDMNDSRLLMPIEQNGIGFDGHWADDLHHTLHALLTGERSGYYEDYGEPVQLARIYERGVAYEGDYSPFRKRSHGRSYEGIDKRRLIVQSQNHDQIGNRLFGERFSTLMSTEKLKLAAACVLLSPCMPLLFMGEELGSENPFLYFISHSDPALLEGVRKGRKEEWKDFNWSEEAPDPADPATFEKCILNTKLALDEPYAAMQLYYKQLIDLSKQIRSMELSVDYDDEHKTITLNYKNSDAGILAFLSFNDKEVNYNLPANENWENILMSLPQYPSETLQPFAALVFKRTP